MRTILLALPLAALVGGCGQASEEAFNREFDSNFRSSCVASATAGGAPEGIGTQICDCTLAGINAKYGMSEKMAMSPEQAEPIMAECVSKAVPAAG